MFNKIIFSSEKGISTSSACQYCSLSIYIIIKICDRACKNKLSEHKKSLIFSSLLYHHLRTIYINIIKSVTTEEFNGFSSKIYKNGISHSEWKILAKIRAQTNLNYQSLNIKLLKFMNLSNLKITIRTAFTPSVCIFTHLSGFS